MVNQIPTIRASKRLANVLTLYQVILLLVSSYPDILFLGSPVLLFELVILMDLSVAVHCS